MNTAKILLSGDRLALAQPRREMLETYHQWENDLGTLMGYGNQVPQSWEAREAGWERQRKNRDYVQFEVVRLEDGAPIGITTLILDTYVRTAEFVMLLGSEFRGQGYATEAVHLTLDWGFHVAALRMVWLKVLEPNEAGRAAYSKAGFRQAGRLRRAGHWMGEVVDELMMDALPEDFPGKSAVRGTLSAAGRTAS
ncbi:GNAT family N-acetyltransferase [Streptomyces sp. NBC_00102]|uniref:GNAT family N-acetyltransferase n=1 Tax=Streptomyces sp. NBC_00102 TaxID=2975652 RepID=UPI002257EEA6|nr:GNAT family protein [Streptomyces sp. NBC_00102]MCX5396941.1 GNAT family N-acetyltransferase [Streptomyces sp. NBC_00102]